MGKMKILQVVGGLGMGGAENLVANYCMNFDSDQNEVTLLCVANYHSVYDRKLQEEGIHVIYLNDIIDRWIKAPGLFQKIHHFILRPFMFHYFIHKLKPDVIHLHAKLSAYIAMSKPTRNTKLYITIHSDPDVWFDSKRGKIEEQAIKWLMKRYRTCVIELHTEMGDSIKKRLGKEVDLRILKNGIELNQFRIIDENYKLRQIYKINLNRKIIGHIGRFVWQKNHIFLIEVFKCFQMIYPDSELWLVGDGVLRSECEQKLREYGIFDKTVFWGIRTDIPQLLKMMDLIIFPSVIEGLSITLIEAQVTETLILASDQIAGETAISNLIEFKSLDEGALSWAQKAKEMIEQQRETVYTNIEEWDIKNVVNEVEMLYRDENRQIACNR